MKSKLKHNLPQYQIKGSDEEHSHVFTTTVKPGSKYFTAIAPKVGEPVRLQWLQIHQYGADASCT